MENMAVKNKQTHRVLRMVQEGWCVVVTFKITGCTVSCRHVIMYLPIGVVLIEAFAW